ncbi:MAG: hypothetical protein DRQ88_04530 [Epsilonproteobacteria bacterium]|nr:MAG: hypothetical protein DRQ89_07465 [Campylobacterota bacterium]RLA67023.1 MAG: hypothetical protein DRQ88_04530 [Campylobacterota bacterium]
MSYQESFKNLIEIQSLQNKILEHQKIIAEEESRIVHIKDQREEREESLTTLKDEIKILESDIIKQENALEKLDSSINTAKNHLKNASTEKEMIALESEIKTWEGEKSTLEETLLSGLDEQEVKAEEIKTNTSFLKGSDETLKEVELEVRGLVNAENIKIDDLKGRIKNLIKSCQPQVRDYFIQANNQYEYKSPIALIESERCNKCQMHLPSSLSQPVETGKVLEHCPNCGRLFIPHSSLA